MMLTFLIEVVLLVFVFIRYGLRTTLHRVASAILVCLALFQLAEYNVCGRFNVSALSWSRLGFVAITLLPPLGVHLLFTIISRKRDLLLAGAYVSSLIFIYVFGFSNLAFNSHVCAGNYAIFQLNNHMGGWFFMYYYFWLFASIFLGLRAMKHANPKQSRVLRYFVSGYLFFLLPTTVINMLRPETTSGIPSIMCGFAVIYAVVLVFGILPLHKLGQPKR